jgi:hypothetical protein
MTWDSPSEAKFGSAGFDSLELEDVWLKKGRNDESPSERSMSSPAPLPDK